MNKLDPEYRDEWLDRAMKATDTHPRVWERNCDGGLRRGAHDCLVRERRRLFVWLRCQRFSYCDIAEITLGRRSCHVTVMDAIATRKRARARALARPAAAEKNRGDER